VRKLINRVFCITISFFLLTSSFSAIATASSNTSNEENIKKISSQLESTRMEHEALDSRLIIINKSIAQIHGKLQQEQEECDTHRDKMNERLVGLYKNGDIGFLEVLLNIRDFEDFLIRVDYIARINESTQILINKFQKENEQTITVKNELEQTKSEALCIKNEKLAKINQLEVKLAEQKRLMASLTSREKNSLKADAQQRKSEKINNSMPIGTNINIVKCTVSPYLNEFIYTTARMPQNYSATGIKFSGVASWYGNEFNGRPTASGEIFNENDFTCASRTLPFGTYLKVSYGGRHIVVRVNDRGPYVNGRVLDLSKASARALGVSGIGNISAEIIKPN